MSPNSELITERLFGSFYQKTNKEIGLPKTRFLDLGLIYGGGIHIYDDFRRLSKYRAFFTIPVYRQRTGYRIR